MPQGIGEPGQTPTRSGPHSGFGRGKRCGFRRDQGGRNAYAPLHENQMQAVADNNNEDYP